MPVGEERSVGRCRAVDDVGGADGDFEETVVFAEGGG